MRLLRADGVLANEHFDTLTSMLEDYEAEQARVCHGAELPQRSPGSPSPRCWSCDDLRPAAAVLSTSEYRGNPVGEADAGF